MLFTFQFSNTGQRTFVSYALLFLLIIEKVFEVTECRVIEFSILCILGFTWSSRYVAPIQLPASQPCHRSTAPGILAGSRGELGNLFPATRVKSHGEHGFSDHIHEVFRSAKWMLAAPNTPFISGAGSNSSLLQSWLETGGLYHTRHFAGPGLAYAQSSSSSLK